MSTRIQVVPYCQFGRDTSWITQEIIEGYVYAWIKGEKYGESYIAKYAQGDPLRMKTFREVLLEDADFDDLKAQIWEELELPAPGSIEFHIWHIERTLADPATPVTEHAKLYKILGEYQGWITKPGEGKAAAINIFNNGNGTEINPRNLSDADASLIYASWASGR